MRRIRLNDDQRMRMLCEVKPQKTAPWTYDTMDLVTGVFADGANILLTKIYHLHEGIRRSGDNYSEYRFLLFAGGRAYVRECLFYTDTKEYKLLEKEDGCPVSDKQVLEMIRFYFRDYDYLEALCSLAKEQYGLEGYNIVQYNKRFVEEQYFSV